MLLSAKDLQHELRISRDRAYALMHSTVFPAMKLGGRYYVDSDELKKWVRNYAHKTVKL